MSVERINEGPPWWAKALCGLALFGFGYGVGTVAGHEQAENLRELTPENPVAQASVEHERHLRYEAEHREAEADSTLSACMSDRSILQAVQGVQLPRITSREASR